MSSRQSDKRFLNRLISALQVSNRRFFSCLKSNRPMFYLLSLAFLTASFWNGTFSASFLMNFFNATELVQNAVAQESETAKTEVSLDETAFITAEQQTAQKFLTQNVGNIPVRGLPGPILVYGENAFPVIVGQATRRSYSPLVAGTFLGKGRMIAFGHGDYLNFDPARKSEDVQKLIENCLIWLAQKENTLSNNSDESTSSERLAELKKEIKIGIWHNNNYMLSLKDQGFNVVLLSSLTAESLAEIDVVVADATGLNDAEYTCLFEQMKENGKGFLTSGLAWGWLQITRGKNLQTEHEGNRNFLANNVGLFFANGYLEATSEYQFDAQYEIPKFVHAEKAIQELERLIQAQKEEKNDSAKENVKTPKLPPVWQNRNLRFNDQEQLSTTALLAVRSLSDELKSRWTDLVSDSAAIKIPTERQPIFAADVLSRLAYTMEAERDFAGQLTGKTAPSEIKAHPAAENFPGSVPQNTVRLKDQKIDLRFPTFSSEIDMNLAIISPYWQSTGLYAAPGEIITIRWIDPLPKTFDFSDNSASDSADSSKTNPNAKNNRNARQNRRNQGSFLRDGGLQRMSMPTAQSFAVRIGSHSDTLWHLENWQRAPQITIEKPLTEGETQIVNPFGGMIYLVLPFLPTENPPKISVSISGGVAAPYFVKGKTDPQQWKTTIRNNPAPWAELQGNNIVLTVPSEVVRSLDDPETLMNTWDEILDIIADFSAMPRTRVRPERICADRQISAGYMHSGYPVMTWLDVRNDFVNNEKLRTQGNWGFFHELGHNHQSRYWTFDGTTEVTVNYYSLYVYEKLCGQKPMQARGEMSAENIKKNYEKYVNVNKRSFDTWKSDPFLALSMFVEIQNEFGWDPFLAAVKSYTLDSPEKLPRTDLEKRDQWMVRLSRQTGKNLGPFFEDWGVPTSPEARKSLEDLPVWMPER